MREYIVMQILNANAHRGFALLKIMDILAAKMGQMFFIRTHYAFTYNTGTYHF